MSDAELLAPVTPQEQAPPVEAPVEEVKESLTPEQQEDAAIDALIEEKGVDIPGDVGGKLVPLEAVTSLRAKVKTLNGKLAGAEQGSAKATELEGQIAQLQQQLNQALPYAQAYQAALASQQSEAPKGPTAEERAELEDIAKDFDFFNTDGSLDLDRARRQQARTIKAAEKIAGAAVAPLHEQSLKERSDSTLHSAKLTTLHDGTKPHPEVLDYVWKQLHPSVTSTKEGAQQAFAVAVGYAQMLGKMQKGATPAVREAIPPVLLTEKSGGKDHSGPTLTEADKRSARELGLSDKEYSESLASMPAGWGKR